KTDWFQPSQLICAYLTNAEALQESHKDRFDSSWFDGYDAYVTTKHFSRLWQLASKWPKKEGGMAQSLVYRMVGAVDETKTEIYRNCPVVSVRRMILENSDGRDKETLALGMVDSGDSCRSQAYRTVAELSKDELEKLLKSDDKSGALWGAAC